MAQETLERRGTSHVTALDESHQSERAIGYLHQVDNSLLDRINFAQSTLGKDRAPRTAKPQITRLHYPLPNDLLGQIDRVEEALLGCINLAESTLHAKHQDAQEAKFIKEFDNFIDGLEPLDSGPVQINSEFLDPNNDQEFINHLNNLDPPDELDDLEDWTDDVDLFMKSLLHLDKIDELWHISKAKRMWEESQKYKQREQQRRSQPSAHQTQRATVQTKNAPPTWHLWLRWNSLHLSPPIVPKTFLLDCKTRLPHTRKPHHQKP